LTKPGFADAHERRVDLAGDAVPGDGLHLVSGCDGTVGGSGGDDRGREGMVAVGFQRRRQAPYLSCGAAGGGEGVDHSWLVAGECSGLVERHGADGGERFKRGATLDDEAGAGRGADGGEHGDRDRDRERARRRGHQDDQRTLHPQFGITEQRSDDCDQGGDDQNSRDEWPGDPVGETLRATLAVLGVFNRVHDSRQGAVRCRGGHLDVEHAATVHAARQHRLSRLDLDRDRLPGHRRDVERRAARSDRAVGGNALTGTHYQHLADGDVGGGHLDLLVGAPNHRGVWNELQHGAQAASGRRDRPLLERFGHREQERQRCCFAQLAEQDRTHPGNRHQQRHPEPATHQPRDGTGHERRATHHHSQDERDVGRNGRIGEPGNNPDRPHQRGQARCDRLPPLAQTTSFVPGDPILAATTCVAHQRPAHAAASISGRSHNAT
jgi:hypothetical protein